MKREVQGGAVDSARRAALGGMLGVLAGAVGLGACGGDPYVIVKQAPNNPFAGTKRYRLMPITWNGLMMEGKPEADWLAGRNPEQRASWENDKVQATPKVLERFRVEKKDDESIELLQGPPNKGELVIQINVDNYADPFFYATVRILDESGQVIEEFKPPKRGGGWGLAMHLNAFRVFVAVDVLKYLRKRAAGEPIETAS